MENYVFLFIFLNTIFDRCYKEFNKFRHSPNKNATIINHFTHEPNVIKTHLGDASVTKLHLDLA